MVEDIRVCIESCWKEGVGGKVVRRVMGGAEFTKIKYIHSRDT
jgi:hypothetical protein